MTDYPGDPTKFKLKTIRNLQYRNQVLTSLPVMMDPQQAAKLKELIDLNKKTIAELRSTEFTRE